MGYIHKMVVNYIGKIICRKTVGLNKYLVIQLGIFNGYISVNHVVECCFAFRRHFLAYNKRKPGFKIFLYFIF
ncbi:hypothetical protein SDC9_193050 [bioreactor metagenome]|uniref:Uncharacterized protein n=1 Tax=bioreactor metagenome TaxID=1076179 RepID=A0A645IDI5_9ZZZZ